MLFRLWIRVGKMSARALAVAGADLVSRSLIKERKVPTIVNWSFPWCGGCWLETGPVFQGVKAPGQEVPSQEHIRSTGSIAEKTPSPTPLSFAFSIYIAE